MSVTAIGRAFFKFRGTRVVTCPENHQPVAVRVSAMRSTESLRLGSCTRWPEKEGCDEACVRQIEESPEATLVRAIATDWYTAKKCVVCHAPIAKIVWHERPPAVLAPDGTSREWKDVAPQDLPAVLATHQPVCWKCHVTESFRREHAPLVVERPRPVEPERTLEPSVNVY
ncbi:MAG TPA: hypothetical protein VF980_16910 [Thermoanaerobaculia bacterium]|jgi:hypothetical protein